MEISLDNLAETLSIPFCSRKNKDLTACLLSYHHFAVLGAMTER